MTNFYSIHKKLTWALTLCLVTALTVAGFALADNVVNNLDTTIDSDLETKTITAGGSVTVGFYIDPTTGEGDAPGCNATGNDPAYLTITPPAGVTVSWTEDPDKPIKFVGCNNTKDVTFSSNTPGSYTITNFFLTGGKSGSQWNTATAKFTLIVEAAAPSDTTPPVITYTITGTKGNGDWYVSDVFVDWTVTDDESEVTILEGCEDTTIDNDTDGVTLICRASSAGGTSSESVTVKRDATPPTISASLDKGPADTGWFNASTGAPTVSFTCSDATSGLASECPGDYTFGEDADQSYSETIYDNAGNSASAGVSDIDVDLTAPTITWSNGPVNGGVYYFGFVPDAPTCTAADDLSGPDVCTVSGYGNAIGSHTMTAAAKDKAGNETVETRSYTVLAWTLLGFYQPVDMGGVYNVVKGGSTVPLKFEIFAGGTELTDVSAVKSLNLVQVTCNPGTLTDEIEITATGGTVLRYDFTAGQFIYNWQTPKNNVGKCYRVTMTTQDGSSLAAYFKLK